MGEQFHFFQQLFSPTSTHAQAREELAKSGKKLIITKDGKILVDKKSSADRAGIINVIC